MMTQESHKVALNVGTIVRVPGISALMNASSVRDGKMQGGEAVAELLTKPLQHNAVQTKEDGTIRN